MAFSGVGIKWQLFNRVFNVGCEWEKHEKHRFSRFSLFSGVQKPYSFKEVWTPKSVKSVKNVKNHVFQHFLHFSQKWLITPFPVSIFRLFWAKKSKFGNFCTKAQGRVDYTLQVGAGRQAGLAPCHAHLYVHENPEIWMWIAGEVRIVLTSSPRFVCVIFGCSGWPWGLPWTATPVKSGIAVPGCTPEWPRKALKQGLSG